MPRCITAPSEQYKLALAVSMGGMLELYDFLIYALMASYIAGHFFPASDQLTSLLGTFAAFAAGYLTRPLGGLFFGHLGDRFGRKKTFTLTIFLMALTTALMGCLPTYKEVGVVAPLLLVLLRLTQGFSLGGELPGAITYLSESVPQRQGLMIGILFLALMTGISLGTFLLGLLNLLLGEEAMAQWGWRMPFWIGGLLGLFSYHIRRRFDDSGLFVALDQVRQRSTIPLILLLREHRKGLFCGLLLMALCGATVTVYGVYMPSYLSSILDLPRANVVWRTAVAFLVLSPLSLVAGILTDIVNKRLLATCMALAVIVLSFPTFQYFVTESPPIRRIMMTCGLFTALASGLLPPVIVRFFPTEVRYTGIATSYNFGFAIFGGLAPFSSTLIVQKTGFTLGPAYYLAVIGIISLIAVLIPWPDYDMEKMNVLARNQRKRVEIAESGIYVRTCSKASDCSVMSPDAHRHLGSLLSLGRKRVSTMDNNVTPVSFKQGPLWVAATFLSLSPALAFSSSLYEQCLLKQAMEAGGQTTMAEIRSVCSKPSEENALPAVADDSDMAREVEESAFDQRVKGERQAFDNRFVITPHRPNYVLPVSWNSNVNKQPYSEVGEELSSTEIKFQLSLKAPVWEGLWNGYGNVYVAYTNTSWWQAYNSNSAPFRETNHEPEVFAIFPVDYSVLGMDLRAVVVGLSHQSNGRSGNLSRSWNRAYLNFLLEKGDFYMSFKPWYRIPEPEKDPNNPNDTEGDDNPGIEKFMGHGELHFGYKLDEHQISMMLRNNLRFSDNKGAVQLGWSFPLNDRFRGYFQYFNGYGESLIDYNASVNRISVGVMLTDWL